jgi:hypothetical protein
VNGEPTPRRGRLVAAVAVTALLALAGAEAVSAGPPGVWTRISDPTGTNVDEVGIARTPDGVLHVAWLRKDGDAVDLMQTAIGKGGRTLGSPATIVSGWSRIANPALVVSPDGGLRAVFGGTRSTDPGETNTSLNTAAAGESGVGWTLTTGSIAKTMNAYASPAGAALERDGTPVTAWATTFGLGIHVGLDPSADDQIVQTACCAYQPQLATDAASGRVVLGWDSNASGAHGIYLQAVAPAGAKRLAPGSAASPDADEQHTAISARLGAAGVYLAYCGGGTTFCRNVLLWRYGGRKPLAVAKAPDATSQAGERVALGRGPQGRLWVMWERGDRIYAARTNKAATRVGPAVSTATPRGTSAIWKLDGDGADGPLDLLASVSTGAGIATWHTWLLPPLTLTATVHAHGEKRQLAVAVTDAGDPVPGARIRFKSSGYHLMAPKPYATDAHGRLTLTLPAVQGTGSLTLTATKPGYAPATQKASVR